MKKYITLLILFGFFFAQLSARSEDDFDLDTEQNIDIEQNINNSVIVDPVNNTEEKIHTYLQYKGSTRYYVMAEGKVFLDKRRVGPIYPTLFDVSRQGASFDYIESENEDSGCNLEEMFRKSIFTRYGFNIRLYLNALATSEGSCNKLSSLEEQKMCKDYHSNPACQGATPIAFSAIPLPTGFNYINYKKINNCDINSKALLEDTYIPRQSKEWSKIQQDLIDKKRSSINFRAQAPVNQIRQEVLAKNSKATQRDIDFAVNEWAYNQSTAFNVQIPDSEVDIVAEKRYSPASAMRNILDFKSEISGICKGKESRYNNKLYSEGMNIPPHQLLAFADYIDLNNACICRK